MNANEIIAQQACNAILAKGHTPESIALAIGISPRIIVELCNGETVETSTVSLLSRALGVNLFSQVVNTIDKQIIK